MKTLYQAWELFKELLMKCPQHYLTERQEVILFYNGLGIPTRQILDSRGAIPSKTIADAKSDQESKGKTSYATQVGANNARTPYTHRLPTQIRRENPRRSLLYAIGGPFQGGGYKAAALGFYQRNHANPSYEERRQSMEDTLSKFMSESGKIHEEDSNLIKEI
ncbi:hypothetical protein Tco_0590140 [Tanacetum coccineum]